MAVHVAAEHFPEAYQVSQIAALNSMSLVAVVQRQFERQSCPRLDPKLDLLLSGSHHCPDRSIQGLSFDQYHALLGVPRSCHLHEGY
jgi:hypothetical protein